MPAFSSARSGALLPEGSLEAIRDGQTTRREVLEALGPPLAVVRQDQTVVRVPDLPRGMRRWGSRELPAAWFLDRFRSARPLDAREVVYFYREHEYVSSGSAVLLLVPGLYVAVPVRRSVSEEHSEDRLWILVHEGTGLVTAHAHERDEPPRPAPTAPGRREEELPNGGGQGEQTVDQGEAR
jgi:hypothetical protein